MDYETMSSEDYKIAYAKRREQIFSKTYKVGSIEAERILKEEYVELCSDAAGGDPVAEDLLANWFRNGNDVVPENVEISMKWLILAGANGNKFSLDRLKLQFGYAFDQIINLEDFGRICYNYNINEFNYHHVLGKLICDAVVDEMKIDPLELAKQKPFSLPFSSIVMRVFDRAINKATERVIEYLRRK